MKTLVPLDPVEALLREDGRRALPDDGFALRIERALPPAPRARPWLRPALVLGSAALGSALAWLLAPAGTSVAQGFVDLARLQSQTPSAWAALATALVLAVTAAALVADES
jgi:hypothetical protein